MPAFWTFALSVDLQKGSGGGKEEGKKEGNHNLEKRDMSDFFLYLVYSSECWIVGLRYSI